MRGPRRGEIEETCATDLTKPCGDQYHQSPIYPFFKGKLVNVLKNTPALEIFHVILTEIILTTLT